MLGRSWVGSRTRIGDGLGAGDVDGAVVVAELDEDEVAGLDHGEGVLPVAGGDEGVAGEAADGAVDDVDLVGVEEVGDGRAPSPEAVGTGAMAVADGGVTDEEDGGEIGVFGGDEAKADLQLGVGAKRTLGATHGRAAGAGSAGCRGLLGGEGEEREEAGDGGCEERGRGERGLSLHGSFFHSGGADLRWARIQCLYSGAVQVNVRMVIRPIGNKFNGDKWETVLV